LLRRVTPAYEIRYAAFFIATPLAKSVMPLAILRAAWRDIAAIHADITRAITTARPLPLVGQLLAAIIAAAVNTIRYNTVTSTLRHALPLSLRRQ